MSNDFFDFGFTATDAVELEVLREKEKQIESVAGDAGAAQERLERLFNAIQPLLNNLKANPEKDYIFWPGRLTKIESFEDHLQDIYTGKK